MNISSISKLYMETHTVSHIRTRIQEDSAVNNAVDCTLTREGSWTKKKSTAVECEAIYSEAMLVNCVTGEAPNFIGDQTTHLQRKLCRNVTSTAKKHMDKEHKQQHQEKLKSLVVQGKNLELASAESTDYLWKSFLYNMRSGTMKFLLNAAIDTLPTAANLQRWKKSPSDKCKLCQGRQTTDHCLNICKVGLETGRWTWRHNNILNFILQWLDTSKYSVFSDLPGHEAAGGGTIPPEVCVTNLKPDIVIIDKVKKELHIFELTCPLETNIEKRHLDKQNKYAHFVKDITAFTTTITAFEVSSRGFINKRNHQHLQALHRMCKAGIKLNTFKKNISSLSIYSSYHIWLCRSDPLFTVPPYLEATFHD